MLALVVETFDQSTPGMSISRARRLSQLPLLQADGSQLGDHADSLRRAEFPLFLLSQVSYASKSAWLCLSIVHHWYLLEVHLPLVWLTRLHGLVQRELMRTAWAGHRQHIQVDSMVRSKAE